MIAPKPRSKLTPWPWKDWMTIGIGVLARQESLRNDANANPNTIILMADTLGSWADQYSHGRVHKAICFPKEQIYAVAANRIDKASEFMPMIAATLGSIQPADREYAHILHSIVMSAHNYKRERFNIEIVSKFFVTPFNLEALQRLPDPVQGEARKAWEEFDIGVDLVIGTFDGRGRAFLFVIDGRGTVENLTFPGYAAIGSGGDNAMFWLGYREHVLSMSPRRAAYHAYEAKLMAEKSPHVNSELDIVFAQPGACEVISSHHPPVGKSIAPFDRETLKAWHRQFRPRKTLKLDEDQL